MMIKLKADEEVFVFVCHHSKLQLKSKALLTLFHMLIQHWTDLASTFIQFTLLFDIQVPSK